MELHQDLKTSFQMTKVTEYSKENKNLEWKQMLDVDD